MPVSYEKFLAQTSAVALVAFDRLKADPGLPDDDVYMDIGVGADEIWESVRLSFGSLSDLRQMTEAEFNLLACLTDKLSLTILSPAIVYIDQLLGRNPDLTHVCIEVEFQQDGNKYGVEEIFVAIPNLME